MEGKQLNIPSYIEDPSYRYKMPALQLRTEGRLNGVKTKIINLDDLAKALRVPPTYPLKFMGYELGSQTHDSSGIINGDFKEPELRKLLDKFIEKYVMCPGCTYPEMVLKIKKETITGSCNSCGKKAVLDNAHKLAAHIVKNPPKNASEFKSKDGKDAKDTKDTKDAKDSKDVKVKEEKTKTEKTDKEKSSKKEKDPKKPAEKEAESSDDEPTEEEKAKEKKPAEEAPKIVVFDFKSHEEENIGKIREVYNTHKALESFEDHDAEIDSIIDAALKLGVPEEQENKIPSLVFSAIFDINIAKEVSKNAPILSKLYSKLKIQNIEHDILLNLERFLLVRHEDQKFEKYVPTILKLFYDDDLLSEEFLIDWADGKFTPIFMMDFKYEKERDNKFKAAAKPFVDWLRTADTE